MSMPSDIQRFSIDLDSSKTSFKPQTPWRSKHTRVSFACVGVLKYLTRFPRGNGTLEVWTREKCCRLADPDREIGAERTRPLARTGASRRDERRLIG